MKQKNKSGFSLIELLVVILIIGILAAVAIPKYQVMTKVSKIKALYPQMRSLVEARTRYYQANRVFTTDMEALDVQIPYNRKVGNRYYTDWGLVDLIDNEANIYGGAVRYEVNNTNVTVRLQYGHQTVTYGRHNNGYCIAPINNSLANKICKQLGEYGTNNVSQNLYFF